MGKVIANWRIYLTVSSHFIKYAFPLWEGVLLRSKSVEDLEI